MGWTPDTDITTHITSNNLLTRRRDPNNTHRTQQIMQDLPQNIHKTILQKRECSVLNRLEKNLLKIFKLDIDLKVQKPLII